MVALSKVYDQEREKFYYPEPGKEVAVSLGGEATPGENVAVSLGGEAAPKEIFPAPGLVPGKCRRTHREDADAGTASQPELRKIYPNRFENPVGSGDLYVKVGARSPRPSKPVC